MTVKRIDAPVALDPAPGFCVLLAAVVGLAFSQTAGADGVAVSGGSHGVVVRHFDHPPYATGPRYYHYQHFSPRGLRRHALGARGQCRTFGGVDHWRGGKTVTGGVVCNRRNQSFVIPSSRYRIEYRRY